MNRTLIALVEDKPGVLNRVASLFRRRAFNIESLTVGHTERPGISRMTIVVDSDHTDVQKVAQNLYKLVNVIQVDDVTEQSSVVRDLALIRVQADSHNRSQVLQIVDTFRARVVDVARNSLVIELSGPEEKLEAFIDLLHPYGIRELARTGVIAMPRGQQNGPKSTAD